MNRSAATGLASLAAAAVASPERHGEAQPQALWCRRSAGTRGEAITAAERERIDRLRGRLEHSASPARPTKPVDPAPSIDANSIRAAQPRSVALISWQFIRAHRGPLAFGFVHAFCSGPGQTFCIALFVASFAATFDASAAELGAIYLFATLAAALVLSRVGAWIDRVALRAYSIGVSGLLVAACLSTALAPNLAALAFGLFGLRLAGQGLMMHIQATATARAFTDRRGSALGVTGLGLPLAAAVFPPVAAFLVATVGWRWAYAAIGLAVVPLLAAAATWMLPRTAEEPRLGHAPDSTVAAEARDRVPPFRLGRLLGDGYFWAAVPAALLVSFIATGLLFQMTVIAQSRQWDTGLVAGSLSALAVAQVAALFASGRFVDRYSARALTVLHGIPITAAVVLLAAFDQEVALLAAMIGAGASAGAAQTALTAVWAERYGTRHFGAIRGLVTSLMVIATALAPAVFGFALSIADASAALWFLAAVAVALQLPLLVFEAVSFRSRSGRSAAPE